MADAEVRYYQVNVCGIPVTLSVDEWAALNSVFAEQGWKVFIGKVLTPMAESAALFATDPLRTDAERFPQCVLLEMIGKLMTSPASLREQINAQGEGGMIDELSLETDIVGESSVWRRMHKKFLTKLRQ